MDWWEYLDQIWDAAECKAEADPGRTYLGYSALSAFWSRSLSR